MVLLELTKIGKIGGTLYREMEANTWCRGLTYGLRNLRKSISHNLSPQGITSQETLTVGTDGAGLCCPGSHGDSKRRAYSGRRTKIKMPHFEHVPKLTRIPFNH
jgi:hypothetical protein